MKTKTLQAGKRYRHPVYPGIWTVEKVIPGCRARIVPDANAKRLGYGAIDISPNAELERVK